MGGDLECLGELLPRIGGMAGHRRNRGGMQSVNTVCGYAVGGGENCSHLGDMPRMSLMGLSSAVSWGRGWGPEQARWRVFMLDPAGVYVSRLRNCTGKLCMPSLLFLEFSKTPGPQAHVVRLVNFHV